jgi:hypothetical protein
MLSLALRHNCNTSTTDVKELIPEFYYLPEFLINRNGYGSQFPPFSLLFVLYLLRGVFG